MSIFPVDEFQPDAIRQNISPPSLKRKFISDYSLKPTDRTISVLQWNILAQALSYSDGNFNRVKSEMVAYQTRKWRVLEQILIYKPDLCSLQEIDIFDCFLKDELDRYGYNCFFTPKPNSKCLSFQHDRENFKGPDGVLLCYRRDLFKEIQRTHFILPDDGRIGQQVASILKLEYKPSSTPIIFAGTHFKAKKQYASSRVNQANAMIQHLNQHYSQNKNIIIAGDFNGEPDEPFYNIFIRSGFKSAYRTLMNNNEPTFTTWKFKSREGKEKEESRTIDYIFYHGEDLTPIARLEFPSKTDIGPNALPCANYPSDHLALQSIFLIRV